MRALRRALALSVLVLLAACASVSAPPPAPDARLVDGDVQQLIAAGHATDARYQVFGEAPWLAVDLTARHRLASYPASGSVTARRDFILAFLDEAQALGAQAVHHELAHVAPDQLAAYAASHGLAAGGDEATRRAVEASYAARAAQALAADRTALAALDEAAALDSWWAQRTASLQPSIMTRGRLARRLLTAPAVPFIAGWIDYHNRTDDRGPRVAQFAAQQVYRLDADSPAPTGIDAASWALLLKHAPTIVQERATTPTYPATDDHFGEVHLRGTSRADATPTVDAGHPALYAFVEHKTIQGTRVRQLVYVLWYPEHPRLQAFDPEAGPLDGWTLRLTLDAEARVQVVESVSNCGCYYRIFPGAALERAAAAAYAQPLAGKRFRLEQHQSDRYDAVVPELIEGLDGDGHLVAWFSAAHHQLVMLRAPAALDLPQTAAVEGYRLHPYEELEDLPLGSQPVGLFDEDGLVRHADRPECTLLAPSGVYHAGHPRQRGTQMIYFDEAEFDDPALLEHYLRLPPAAFGRDT